MNDIKEENNVLPADKILHEATTVLQAALQHALELSEVGVTDDEYQSHARSHYQCSCA